MKDKELWNVLKVRWDFEGRLCGSVPMQKDLVGPWLQSRMGEVDPEVEAEVLETIDEAQDRVTLGFQKDENGIFVRGGTVKAHLKDSANQIKDILGIKNLRSKVANRIYVAEYRIYIERNGETLQEPDSSFDQPIHVITPRGPRNSLKTIGFVEKAYFIFTVKLLQDKEITREVLQSIFEYGGLHGYGGERGMGEGRYRAAILS